MYVQERRAGCYICAEYISIGYLISAYTLNLIADNYELRYAL